jgi:hypothetical protein
VDVPVPGADPELVRELTQLDGRFAAGDLSEALILRWGEVLAQCRCPGTDGPAAPLPPVPGPGWARTG